LVGADPKPERLGNSHKNEAQQREKKVNMGTKLYVGNLSFGTTEGDLRKTFESCGSVTSCSIIIDKFTGKSRGFGFVEMSSADEANKAISQLHGKEIEGRALTVNEAKPREDRPRGGGGGFGGGGGGGGFGGGGGRGGDRGDRGDRGGRRDRY